MKETRQFQFELNHCTHCPIVDSVKNILYLSDASRRFSEKDLHELAAAAAKKNASLDVTGYLCYADRRFMQYIEGENETVTALMDVIRNDRRHRVVFESHDEHLDRRRFPSWSMRHIKDSELANFNIEVRIQRNLQFIADNLDFKGRCREVIDRHLDTMEKYYSHYRRKCIKT